MWCRIFALLILGCASTSETPTPALRGQNRTLEERHALEEGSSLQEGRALEEGRSLEEGPVQCICKDSEDKYYCAESFAGFHLCYQPCSSLCSQTHGRMFMCGGKHETMWLERFFKNQMESDKRCKLDQKGNKGKK